MKALKTIISIVFIVGTIAIIFFDGKTRSREKPGPSAIKVDSVSQSHQKK